MDRKVVSEITLTLLLASMLSVSMTSVAKAEETVVAVDPPAVTATVGQIFSINITITDVYAEAGHGGLWLWMVKIRWNPDVLRVAVDELGAPLIEDGPFLRDVGPTLFIYSPPRPGEIPEMCCVLLVAREAEGSGTLATITFNVTAAGETDIIIYETDLVDFDENPIPHTVVNGHVTVITVEALSATINFHPGTLNLLSKGKWVACCIELPEGYDVSDIDASTIMLDEMVSAESEPATVTPRFMRVRFSRAEVTSYIFANVDMTELSEERFMTVTLTVTGYLNDGTPFRGDDAVRILLPMPRSWRFLETLEFPIPL